MSGAAKEGDRVVVLCHNDRQRNYILGRGVFVATEVPTDSADLEAVYGLAEFSERGIAVQKIALDDSDANGENRGQTVWGIEGWLATEEGFDTYMTSRETVRVSLADWREERPRLLMEQARQRQAAMQRQWQLQSRQQPKAILGHGYDEDELHEDP